MKPDGTGTLSTAVNTISLPSNSRPYPSVSREMSFSSTVPVAVSDASMSKSSSDASSPTVKLLSLSTLKSFVVDTMTDLLSPAVPRKSTVRGVTL